MPNFDNISKYSDHSPQKQVQVANSSASLLCLPLFPFSVENWTNPLRSNQNKNYLLSLHIEVRQLTHIAAQKTPHFFTKLIDIGHSCRRSFMFPWHKEVKNKIGDISDGDMASDWKKIQPPPPAGFEPVTQGPISWATTVPRFLLLWMHESTARHILHIPNPFRIPQDSFRRTQQDTSQGKIIALFHDKFPYHI